MDSSVAAPNQNEQASACLFHLGQAVRHLKSGGIYIIAILPTTGVLEATGEPAYGYMGDNSKIYFRNQVEMEDGRFVPHILPSNTIAH